VDKQELHAQIQGFSEWCLQHGGRAIICVAWINEHDKLQAVHSALCAGDSPTSEEDIALAFIGAADLLLTNKTTGKTTLKVGGKWS
jgi:hypothetical protein